MCKSTFNFYSKHSELIGRTLEINLNNVKSRLVAQLSAHRQKSNEEIYYQIIINYIIVCLTQLALSSLNKM